MNRGGRAYDASAKPTYFKLLKSIVRWQPMTRPATNLPHINLFLRKTMYFGNGYTQDDDATQNLL